LFQIQVDYTIREARKAKAWGQFKATFEDLLDGVASYALDEALRRLHDDELGALVGASGYRYMDALPDDTIEALCHGDAATTAAVLAGYPAWEAAH
jgi:hypothetical protein